MRNQVPLSISHVLHTIHATDKHRMQKLFQKNDNAMPHENSTMLLEQKNNAATKQLPYMSERTLDVLVIQELHIIVTSAIHLYI